MNFKITQAADSFPPPLPKGMNWKRATFAGNAFGNGPETSGIQSVIMEMGWKSKVDERETSPRPTEDFIGLQISVGRSKRHV